MMEFSVGVKVQDSLLALISWVEAQPVRLALRPLHTSRDHV